VLRPFSILGDRCWPDLAGRSSHDLDERSRIEKLGAVDLRASGCFSLTGRQFKLPGPGGGPAARLTWCPWPYPNLAAKAMILL